MSEFGVTREVFVRLCQVLEAAREFGAEFDGAWRAAEHAVVNDVFLPSQREDVRQALAQRRNVYESLYYKDQVTEAKPPATWSYVARRER